MTDKPTLYFAESCPYGTTTLSEGDQLIRFDGAEERAQWLADDDRQTKRALGPEDRSRIHRLGGAVAAGIIRDGLFIPAEYAPEPPSSYRIG